MASTFCHAAFSREVAALSVWSPCHCRGHLAQVPDGRGRHAAAGDVLRDAVTEFRRAVPGEDEVEPAQDRAILGDEDVEGADFCLLLGLQRAVPLGELVEELIAPVGDRGSEAGAGRCAEYVPKFCPPAHWP